MDIDIPDMRHILGLMAGNEGLESSGVKVAGLIAESTPWARHPESRRWVSF